MSMYIDIKYLNLISHRLQRFKKKGDYLWNFRCPYCGDSKKSQSKARGFVFRKKNDLFFKCHNCSMGTNLSNLVKHIDSKVHDDYILVFTRFLFWSAAEDGDAGWAHGSTPGSIPGTCMTLAL